ncbi:hypothetical protein CLAFUW4_02661 [Fulvia fulva]|uniref:Uncharacterized protein n=1 Tax=Passalora fulva TaxID=5499 RepID=A0A9Q8LBJ3_PASFU|nr:uncharacterized protein CLAFUR5_02651 [Fulvia fulva]KAK4631377.1 hypothetical protein CLAFUR4_02656 [Fulvia fulva]UJO14407.1 hypothetical protein CLAFUR5_02651 [Fulvia fulva]WPV10864.1 hypothetical protein CLAFUW4_02661 [Fulvia fulva]WPV25396.1 hypothetical protein CLAFUW7_02660 [Fulvia fulva]
MPTGAEELNSSRPVKATEVDKAVVKIREALTGDSLHTPTIREDCTRESSQGSRAVGHVEEHSTETLWQETGVANQGCIAVFIQRGHLSAASAKVDDYHSTFPPVTWYHKHEDVPKAIRPSWFTPISGTHSQPTIFELRNLLRTTPDTPSENPDTSDSGGVSADESSDDEIKETIAASLMKTGSQVRTSSSPPAEVKLERKQEVFKKTVSYNEVTKYSKPPSTTRQTKRPSAGCCHADDDEDDEDPLPVKREPGIEDDHGFVSNDNSREAAVQQASSRIKHKKRKMDEDDEAELRRCIRESEADAELAQAQLHQIAAERRLAEVRAANKADALFSIATWRANETFYRCSVKRHPMLSRQALLRR